MEQQVKNNKDFLRRDRTFVCSMLMVYGLCICGLIAATIWGLDRRNQQLSANATSTAVAIATREAKATVTAVAHLTEQAEYEVVDRFDTNINAWREGPENNDYWNGYISVQRGAYRWEVRKTKETFVSWADYSDEASFRDFDVYVDTRVVKGDPGDVCSGFLFRVSPAGWDAGGYYFGLCNNSRVRISYHTESEGWENITEFVYRGYSDEWNRLAIVARGKHFTFLINGDQVYGMNDDRQSAGSLALAIDLNETVPVEVLFDNFGLQTP